SRMLARSHPATRHAGICCGSSRRSRHEIAAIVTVLGHGRWTLAELRVRASKLAAGIEISARGRRLMISFHPRTDLDGAKLGEVARQRGTQVDEVVVIAHGRTGRERAAVLAAVEACEAPELSAEQSRSFEPPLCSRGRYGFTARPRWALLRSF